jgi:putative component of membrane protein insertase Oxa1/YidC/SpoIIIJ protein YidD
MYLSLKKYGLFKGILKGILRILRCNSFFPGGEDMP